MSIFLKIGFVGGVVSHANEVRPFPVEEMELFLTNNKETWNMNIIEHLHT